MAEYVPCFASDGAMVQKRTIEELLGREKGECRLYTIEQ
jgi:hypothetical protein